MHFTLLEWVDLIGTIAFAISGAIVGIRKNMDIFGVNILAMTTACGGGLMRDLILGHTPPNMFRNPFFAITALIVANIVFWAMYRHHRMPGRIAPLYDKMLFWSDTFGLAAFTADGVMIGIHAGHKNNLFLIVFLGFLTGVGGGALRDIMAAQTPDIFVKHVYALASIVGGILMALLYNVLQDPDLAMLGGFILVILLRYLANRYEWNLPKVSS